MLERIKNQIKEIDEILEKLKTLDETVEPLLKSNKYVKKITEQYFNEDENIIKTIKNTKTLIKELKNNYIKLTEEQKQTEKNHKNYIEDIKKSLEKIKQVLKRLETEKVYIDNEIIDILDLNEIEDLKQIIEFNKIVMQKKNGSIIEQKIESLQVRKEEKQTEPKQEETKIIPENLKQSQIKKKKEKKEKPEKIIIFKNMEEIKEYLKTTYDIEIETDIEEQELNEMIEILENEPYEIKDKDLIKFILENSCLQRLKDLKGYFKKTKDDIEKMKLIPYIYDMETETSYLTYHILNSPIETEKKLKLYEKSEERKKTISKNLSMLITIGLENIPIDLLITKIDDEKIEQIIELGHLRDLYILHEEYKRGKIKNIQFKDAFEKKIMKHMPRFFMEKVSKIGEKEKNVLKELTNDYMDFIQSVKKGDSIESTIVKMNDLVQKEREKCNKSREMKEFVSSQKMSTNPILMKEKETSKYAKENFLQTYISFQRQDNPIYTIDNKYIKLLEKYTNIKKATYSIPIKKVYCKDNKIEISRNKFSRLINAHILKGDEITPEIVKQCLFYNLAITEELLQELDRVLTEQFKMLDQKTKKY